MLAADADCSAAADSSLVVKASALGRRAGIVPVDLHQSGSLTVAAEGRLRWREPELAAVCAASGNAAAVAQAYRQHGSECLRYVGGGFAIAVLDVENGNALLAVDRMGIRPLCYANPPGELVFGSSAETVARHPRVGARLSEQALFNYLYCHVVPSPGTIYRGVYKLQPGECLVFRNGVAEHRFYWRLRYRDRNPQPMAELEDRFRTLLREATTRAAGEDDAVGAFLSGGTDSSTVTGLLTELRGKPARSYSIGFAAEGFDEMSYARVTARHFGAQAREYYVTPEDVVDTVPLIAKACDEPFGNASAVPTYLCARMAHADGVRVLLAGDGGDEIFGGNARYGWQKIFEAYAAVPAWFRRGVLEPIVFAMPGGDALPPWRKMKSYIEQARIPLPERLESYNFLRRAPLAEIFEPEFLASVDPAQPLELQRQAYGGAGSASAVNRMMHLDLKFALADNDLRKVSRMSEAAGVEARYPLIDDALVEFSGELPPALKVRGLKLRYFFKHALRDFLPPETLSKKKHGFGLPFGLWAKEHRGLRELVQESLLAFGRRRIVRASYIQELLRRHGEDHATYFGVMMWVMLMLERWLAERKL